MDAYAADFAFELLDTHAPPVLEIRKLHGGTTETVWNYSATAVASLEVSSRAFGFDPTRWNPDLGSVSERRT